MHSRSCLMASCCYYECSIEHLAIKNQLESALPRCSIKPHGTPCLDRSRRRITMNFHKKKLPGVLPSAALAASVLMASFSGQAFADCERGALDTLYCDENGDMVADLPADKSKWNDPNTLIFAYTPVEDPAIYSDIWQPFIDHLSEVTGRDVRFFAVQSNSAQVEAMRSGRLHIAGFSTGPTPFAVNLAGAVPFALMGSETGQFGYTLQVFTHADSDIHEMKDLKGKRVAHTSQRLTQATRLQELCSRKWVSFQGMTTRFLSQVAMTNPCLVWSQKTTMLRP